MKTISFAVYRGGNGKTTSALAATAYYAEAARKKGQKPILLIDMDAQASATAMYDIDEAKPTMIDVLMGKAPINEAIQAVAENVSLIPSTLALSKAETDLPAKGRLLILRKALESVSAGYSKIIIDTPPSLTVASLLALAAAEGVVIPVQADYFSLRTIENTLEVIEDIKTNFNPALQVLGVLITRYPTNTVLGRQIWLSLRKNCSVNVFEHVIRETVTVRESQMMRQDIFAYAGPESKPAMDYINTFREIDEIERGLDNGNQELPR